MSRKKKKDELKLYTKEQTELIEKHIEEYFGELDNYYQETDSEDIRVDIFVIPPTVEKRFYTLVTMGMGAHKMNVPQEYAEDKLERAELVLCLPPNWDFEAERCGWPLHLLKMIAKLPVEKDSWLSWGHSIDYGDTISDEAQFCAIMLIDSLFGLESTVCKMPDGEEVNFYQVVPLFRSEINFKIEKGAKYLMREFDKNSLMIADPDREPVIREDYANIIDSYEDHAKKIEAKELDTLDINAANHIAAFLKWCIAHKMINDEFKNYFAEEIAAVKSGEFDIRRFLINNLGGEFTMDMLTEEGAEFAGAYYDFYNEPKISSYPSDIDKMALKYFGKERYESDEFNNEAYLFVPFSDDYIKNMYKYINKAYKKFKETA